MDEADDNGMSLCSVAEVCNYVGRAYGSSLSQIAELSELDFRAEETRPWRGLRAVRPFTSARRFGRPARTLPTKPD